MDMDHPMYAPTPLFREVQHLFRNPLLLVIMPVSMVTTTVILLGLAVRTGDRILLWVWGGITLLEIAILALPRMETIVTDRELRVTFRPLYRRRIPVKTIDSFTAVRYDPFESGGWGIRFSRRYGRVLTVWGNQAVAVEAGDRKLLIGTQRPEEFETALLAAAGRRKAAAHLVGNGPRSRLGEPQSMQDL